MNKNTGITIGVIVLVLIALGVYASMSTKDDAMMAQKTNDSVAINQESETMIKDEPMNKESASMPNAEMAKKPAMDQGDKMLKGTYEAYAPEKIARAATGDVVLFFHASWCPSCKGLDADIMANLNSIPAGVSILKVDYDQSAELKQQYGVTYQHTLVQVDQDGKLIKKWSGSPKLSNLLSSIQ